MTPPASHWALLSADHSDSSELNCGIEGSGDAGMFVGCSEDDMRTFRERVMLRLALFEQLRTAM